MGFAHGWFGMTLEFFGSDSHDFFFFFEILSDFWKKSLKKSKEKIWAKIGPFVAAKGILAAA